MRRMRRRAVSRRPVGVVPLLQGMDAAALAPSRSDGDGGHATRERQCWRRVEPRRGSGAEGEVTIDGAEGVEEGGVVRKGSGRAISDGFNVEF